MNTFKLRRIIPFLGVFLFTFLLLETTIRILWWREPTINMLGRDITLLPAPLVTETQTRSLETWRRRDDSFVQFDPVLGWSIRPGAMSVSNEITYTANSIGIRSSREYDENKSEAVTRIAAFGPSFTFGDEVPDHFAWPVVLEQSYPDLEAMNWGVSGYGTDQSFMRYENEGMLYQPDIVLIGYEEDNSW